MAMGCLQSLATAQTVNPGFDVYAVEDNSWLDFGSCVIPADFFFSGSDPFNGVIDLGPDWSPPTQNLLT